MLADAEKTIWNDEVKKFYDEPVPVSVWEKFKIAVIEDETDRRKASGPDH